MLKYLYIWNSEDFKLLDFFQFLIKFIRVDIY